MNNILKKIKTMWGLDLRSLAFFRIAAAICIIGDFRMRASDLVAHYTDFGILPRNVLLEFFLGPWAVSFHLLSGLWQIQALMFALSIIFALMLLVGYRTKLATFFSWLLLVSVQMRNPMVLQGGDVLFRVILFWSLFLPLGACYSVDRAMDLNSQPKDKTIFSMATVAFILQIGFLYWFAAAIKMSGASKIVWWDQGMAVYNALSIDQLTRPLGQYLLGFPMLLKGFNYATLLFEMLGSFLFFMPVWTAPFRIIGVFGFILMHVSFALCMLVGPFSFIGSISVLPMLPGVFWDKLADGMIGGSKNSIKVYYDQDCGFCKKMVMLFKTFCFIPDEVIHAAQEDAGIFERMQRENSWIVLDSKGVIHTRFDAVLVVLRRLGLLVPISWMMNIRSIKNLGNKVYKFASYHRPFFSRFIDWMHFKPVKTRLSLFGNILAGVFLAFVFFWNMGTVNPRYAVPVKLQPWGLVLALDQYWNMFSPPLTDDGWYVIPGKLRDGTEVDIFKNGAPVDWTKPKCVYRTYKNTRWRKYLMNIWMTSNAPHRLYYGRYLCREWNANHPENKWLDQFDIDFMQETTLPYMTPVAKKVLVWRHYCFKVPEPEAAPVPVKPGPKA